MLSDKTVEYLLRTMDLIMLGANVAPAVYASYTEARNKLKLMVQEGRDPSEAEWAEMEQQIRMLQNELHGKNDE